MHTEVISWTAAGAIERAVELLADDQLVAFPTDTVYGLAVRADSSSALDRIYAVKGRPAEKALIIHVAGIDDARRWAARWPPEAELLAKELWPGPLTLVVKKVPGARLAARVTAHGSTVAVRAPAHAAARRLVSRCAFPIAAPSANPSGAPPPLDAGRVLELLGGRIPLIIDGGTTPEGAPSTIVDVSGSGPPAILRVGALSRQRVAEIVPLR